jgi:arsenate reductase
MPEDRIPSVLFLCTGNSCRSQMAEGLARALHGDHLLAYSAGIEAHGMNPRAVQVMAEVDVDLTTQKSKTVRELPTTDFDLVITVCGHADKHCPTLPGARRVIHVPFEDPPKLAAKAGDEAAALDCFRRVRDEIREFLTVALPSLLMASPPGESEPDRKPE